MSYCVSLKQKTRGMILQVYRQGVPEDLYPDRPLTAGPWQVCGFESIEDMLEYLKPIHLRVVRMKSGRICWLTNECWLLSGGRNLDAWVGYHWVWDNDEQKLAEEIAIARYQKGV